MEYIKNYNSYTDDLVVEKLNLQPVLDAFKLMNSKKFANIIVGSLLAVMTVTQTIDFITNLNSLQSNQKQELIQTVEKFRDPLSFSLSKSGYEHIKSFEKLELTAYNLKDGKVTVGYGHAEPIRKSKIKVGQLITQDMANMFLEQDIKVASEGIRRMFTDWKNQGSKIKITQSQFDVLVSMAFNMGVSGLRNSEFIENLQHSDIKTASELIKNTGLRDGFAGLIDRREVEYNMFIS